MNNIIDKVFVVPLLAGFVLLVVAYHFINSVWKEVEELVPALLYQLNWTLANLYNLMPSCSSPPVFISFKLASKFDIKSKTFSNQFEIISWPNDTAVQLCRLFLSTSTVYGVCPFRCDYLDAPTWSAILKTPSCAANKYRQELPSHARDNGEANSSHAKSDRELWIHIFEIQFLIDNSWKWIWMSESSRVRELEKRIPNKTFRNNKTHNNSKSH